MSNEYKLNDMENADFSDITEQTLTDFTQIASCAFGKAPDDLPERRNQTLRAKLEQVELDKAIEESFITTFRNLFKKSA